MSRQPRHKQWANDKRVIAEQADPTLHIPVHDTLEKLNNCISTQSDNCTTYQPWNTRIYRVPAALQWQN